MLVACFIDGILQDGHVAIIALAAGLPQIDVIVFDDHAGRGGNGRRMRQRHGVLGQNSGLFRMTEKVGGRAGIGLGLGFGAQSTAGLRAANHVVELRGCRPVIIICKH